MKTQTPKRYYCIIVLFTIVFFSIFLFLSSFLISFSSLFHNTENPSKYSYEEGHFSFLKVFAQYDKVILFISSDCEECDKAMTIAEEKKVEEYVDFEIYDIAKQEGNDQYENIVKNTCQIDETITPVLYIDNECITQKTRLKTVIENIPEEVTKYNKGKKNTQILIYLLAGILIGLFILGKILKKEKTSKQMKSEKLSTL